MNKSFVFATGAVIGLVLIIAVALVAVNQYVDFASRQSQVRLANDFDQLSSAAMENNSDGLITLVTLKYPDTIFVNVTPQWSMADKDARARTVKSLLDAWHRIHGGGQVEIRTRDGRLIGSGSKSGEVWVDE